MRMVIAIGNLLYSVVACIPTLLLTLGAFAAISMIGPAPPLLLAAVFLVGMLIALIAMFASGIGLLTDAAWAPNTANNAALTIVACAAAWALMMTWGGAAEPKADASGVFMSNVLRALIVAFWPLVVSIWHMRTTKKSVGVKPAG